MDKLPTDKIYDDLFHPAFEATGKVLSLAPRAIRVALSPFEKWIIEGEKNLDLISEAVSEILADVDPQNIIEPEAYIAVPALQGISYCMDNDELRNRYAKLLASAMQVDKKKDVLPAFTEVIKQMSATDALLLKEIFPNGIFPLVEVRYQEISSPGFCSLPVFREFNRGVSIFDNLSLLLNEGYSIQEVAISLENLARLGIVQFSSKIVEEHFYAPFLSMPCCKLWETEMEHIKQVNVIPEKLSLLSSLFPNVEFALIPKSFYITNFGKLFFETCIS